MARISNERSREIIDGKFEFASHYAGIGHFGLMRIKDSKAMHFISIRQTPMGEEDRTEEASGKQRKKQHSGSSSGSETSGEAGKQVHHQLMMTVDMPSLFCCFHVSFISHKCVILFCGCTVCFLF